MMIAVGSCWVLFIYLLRFKPYKTGINYYFQILNECNISLGYTFTGLLYFKGILDIKILSCIVLSLMYLSYIMHLVIILSTLLRVIIKWIKDKFTPSTKLSSEVDHDKIKIEIRDMLAY
jgi:hypothetical protein